MENTKAIKLVDKILKDLDKTGINTETLIEDIKALRVYAIEQQVPLVVKVLRYTYEHIEANESFLIPMLNDEPLDLDDSDEVVTHENEENSPVENLKYVISLTKNLQNKNNIEDLKEYKLLLMDY